MTVFSRAYLPALFFLGTVSSLFPAAEREAQWDFSLQTSGEDVFWTSPSAIEPSFPAYNYTYEITQLDIRVGSIFPIWISILSRVEETRGEGVHTDGLPFYFIKDSFDDEESGSQANLLLAIDQAGQGRGAITDIVLGEHIGVSVRAIRAAGSITFSGIENHSFTDWQARNFDMKDTKRSAPEADPDNYGIPILLRYALHLDPHQPDRNRLPGADIALVAVEGNEEWYPRLTYTRLADANDLEYTVEVSSNLLTWHPAENPVILIEPAANGATETVVLRESMPLNRTGNRFMRLSVRLMGDGGNEPEANAVVSRSHLFAWNFYTGQKEREQNLVFSPISIFTSLSMLHAGAREETAREIGAILHLSSTEDPESGDAASEKLHFSETLLPGETAETGILSANALWSQEGSPFLAEYRALVETRYGADLHLVDFITAPEAARLKINTWVENRTEEKIRELLKPGLLSEQTRLVLVNAITFKGNWAAPFPPENTRLAPFHPDAQTTVSIPVMHQRTNLLYIETQQAKLVKLPYAGNNLSMVVILPNAGDQRVGFEAPLTHEVLEEWLDGAVEELVDIHLPRFELASSLSLNEPLQTMGMVTAFSHGSADFSGMFESSQLALSTLVHKAFVRVDEEGTEAAASTGATAGITSVSPPREFHVDRPFLFVIRDNHHGAILFLGRVTNPSEDGG